MDRITDFIAAALTAERVKVEISLNARDADLERAPIRRTPNGVVAKLNHEGVFADDLFFSLSDGAVVCERRLKNITSTARDLFEARCSLFFQPFGDPRDDFFYHAENPRIYSRFAVPVDARRGPDMVAETEYDAIAGNKWVDAYDADERIGYSPYQPFPAILVSNRKSRKGVVHGTLSQRVFFHYYLVRREGELLRLDIVSAFKSVDRRELKPGEVIEDRWYLGETNMADDLRVVFADYARVLRKHLPPLYGATAINRHSAVWGSWNDGIKRDIDQERLLKMAAFIADNLPTVKWLQIDDGYAKYADELNLAHGLGAPFEENGGVDMEKFPRNLPDFVEKVRETGIFPAIWVGGHVPAEAPLGKAKPEWFFDYGFRPNVKSARERGVQLRYLDVSKPEVREYMCRALDFFFGECGFRGMKHDFWSYAFEDSRVRLANRDRSGYEWRGWWLGEIRKRLPEYGYLQTGCDIVMGNPFLAEHFTNYRYGIDIGDGNWEHVKTTFLWGSACFALDIGDLFVPNSDAIGLLPGLSDREALFVINYCLISRSMVEVGGWLFKTPNHPRMKWVKKALCCPNNGQTVFFAGFDYRKTPTAAPRVWYLKTPHFSTFADNALLPLRTFAIFNLEDAPETFHVAFADLGLPDGEYLVTNVWDLETKQASSALTFALDGRASGLYALSPADGHRILDANMKLNAAWRTPDGLRVEIDYPGALEIALSFAPAAMTFAGKHLDFTGERRGEAWIARCQIPEKGPLEMSG